MLYDSSQQHPCVSSESVDAWWTGDWLKFPTTESKMRKSDLLKHGKQITDACLSTFPGINCQLSIIQKTQIHSYKCKYTRTNTL